MRIFITILCTVAAFATVNGELELIGVADGFTFYAETELKLSWSHAKEYCRNNGKYFASIDTAAKNSLVSNWLNANCMHISTRGALWTCGTDEGNEHNWYWETSGRFFTFENWHYSQGSDPPLIDLDKNCMGMVEPIGSGSVYWIPQDCDVLAHFVCQG